MNRKRGLLIAAVLALAAAGGGFLVAWKTSTQAPQVEPDGVAQLLALNLPDAARRAHPLEQWRGKVIVANFWATWCAPCLEEIPAFERLNRKYAPKGAQFVGISIDSAEKVRAFAREHQVTYPLLIGTADTLQITAGLGNRVQALPFTVVLDRGGSAHKIKLGKLSEDDLETILRRLL